jgi:uncharacterized protein (DUF1697 family)
MSLQAALLRAVNVGGTGKVPMVELRALAETLGLKNVRSLLHSGNLVFDAGNKSPSASTKLLEAACLKSFGLKTDIYVRTPADIAAVLARNPFQKEAKADPGRLLVLFLQGAPEAKAFKTLQAAIKGPETVRGDGHHAYIFFPDGQGKSRLTLAMIEKHLGTSGTMRNWNTVTKLDALLKA